MRYSNLHTHSTFSDGKHSLEENVLSAIEKNMLSIGFSDHSFTSCDTSYCMKQEDYSKYLQEISRLKEVYKDQIPVYTGLELDFYSDLDWEPYDYLIASVHYIIKDGICYPVDHSLPQQLDCIKTAFGGDVLSMASYYYDIVCENVERVKPTFIGHFDVLTKFGQMPENDEAYLATARRALKRALKTCPYVEVNTGAIARGLRTVPYPSSDLLKCILEENGEVLLSSDSHHRDNLTFHFDESVELLKKVGYDHINIFNGRGFEKVKI